MAVVGTNSNIAYLVRHFKQSVSIYKAFLFTNLNTQLSLSSLFEEENRLASISRKLKTQGKMLISRYHRVLSSLNCDSRHC